MLRTRLLVEGQDPDTLLNGTPRSLVPLWQWATSSLTKPDAPGATDPAKVPRDQWPSWARYSTEVEPVLSFESLRLIDGLVSYLAHVVLQHAPRARWQPGEYPSKRHQFRHHPMLAADHHQVYFPRSIFVKARKLLKGGAVPEDALASHAEAVIAAFNEGVTTPAAPPEPLVEIEEIREEPGGYDFEIGLSDELAHERSAEVDLLVRKLSDQDGIQKVLREDRDLILVRAPSWGAEALRTWITGHI